MSKQPIAYLVIIDGQGETEDDFTVLRLWDTTAKGALEQAIEPSMGYGKRDNACAYVVPESKVTAFKINDTSKRIAQRVGMSQ